MKRIYFFMLLCSMALLCLIGGCGARTYTYKRFDLEKIQQNTFLIQNMSNAEITQIVQEGKEALADAVQNGTITAAQREPINRFLKVICWASGEVYLDIQDLKIGRDLQHDYSYFRYGPGYIFLKTGISNPVETLCHEVGHGGDLNDLSTEKGKRAFIRELRADFNVVRVAKRLQPKIRSWLTDEEYPIHEYKPTRTVNARLQTAYLGFSVSPEDKQELKTINNINNFDELRHWSDSLCSDPEKLPHYLAGLCLVLLESECDSFEELDRVITYGKAEDVKKKINAILKKSTIYECLVKFFEKRSQLIRSGKVRMRI